MEALTGKALIDSAPAHALVSDTSTISAIAYASKASIPVVREPDFCVRELADRWISVYQELDFCKSQEVNQFSSCTLCKQPPARPVTHDRSWGFLRKQVRFEDW